MIPPWNRPARIVTALAALAALVIAAAAAPALADPDTQVVTTAGALTPDQDPFYRPPAAIASYAPGRIVASREVIPDIGRCPDRSEPGSSPTAATMSGYSAARRPPVGRRSYSPPTHRR